jgi:UDP-apiose/xylose synthase
VDIVMLGCGGYIGSHLLDRLLPQDDHRVYGWDLESRKIEHHLGRPNFHFVWADISSPGALAELGWAIRQADVVMNLAAICNPAEYNTEPLRVLKANLFDVHPVVALCAEHSRWLIQFSTSEVYGRTIASYLHGGRYDDPDLYVLDEAVTPLVMGPVQNQRWTYAAAKQVVERLVVAHHAENGMPYTIVRPLNFFGPRMDFLPGYDGEGTPRVLACFMSALIDRRPLRLVDGGTARRTILAIDDAVGAVELMLRSPDAARNQVFNLGNPDNEVTIRELAELMRRTYARITGDRSYTDHPIESVRAVDFYGPGYEDCDRRMPSIANARTRLGWRPTKPLAEILDETMRYYHDSYAGRPQGGESEWTAPVRSNAYRAG